MKEERLWYAVQKDSEDDWGFGSYDYDEAVKMLFDCDEYNIIAVIENDVCEKVLDKTANRLSLKDTLEA